MTTANFVKVKTAILIPPSDPTPSHTLSLSALDSQIFLRFTIEYLLIYSPSNHYDRTTCSSRVKAALAKALVPYYPLAGRVRPRIDTTGLEVICRAQGAGFVEAVSDYTTSTFGHAPNEVAEWRKLLMLDSFKIVPPLVVQLTWLADGSAALAAGFAHCICDGVGSAQFMNLFADLATVRSRLGDVIQVPSWDRHLIDSPKGLTGTTYHPEFISVADECGFMARFSKEKLVPTLITFPKTKLNELKKIAGYGYTSFEVLSAHIWRSWARSLHLPPNQILKLLFSVDVRKRVDPTLPSGFYGNAFVLGCAQIRAKEMVEKGLVHVSGLIKKAKDCVGDAYVREVVDAVSGPGKVGPDQVGVLIISQWSRLGLDRVDFGLGKPVHVGPVCTDRYCLMLPVRNGKEDVKVIVAVPSGAVERYKYLLRCPYS